ncbi:thymidine phosphorylase [Pyrinomonas methylaliphatogenes]|uniref:thymidine phosphorylase n=1 Tax=Pyrinomonas methylaliphatogenes TaxID=454194 RepID=A0A0B6WW59_9BACT|nr:thymidine phosphorylase [Pyrinomonas methylaliphatogenes]MBX5478772.1 thymidine phosphorylase [Pyrinomonas methylaliphatogenes]CDM65503.1 thymidine phosphorylase [Pyrinomonas methylaliphatogenes]
MRPQDVIRHKRDGGELTRDEIAYFVRGVTSGEWADYQASALLMAIFWRGMSEAERLALTEEMLHSGRTLDLSEIPKPKVDKHSTGGVGDKTSLVIAPLAAALGLCVPMISGRGLGHTGGTLDKLESIPGYRVRLSLDEFRDVLKRVGMAMIGQTEEIAPADRKLYALRDVTATVESIPLIAASIMSKKLAEGLNGLVLDVKVGSGAFMKRPKEARALAEALVGIGRGAGVRTVALLTDMDQPLGNAVGNALEVIECLETLRGRGPKDLTSLCIELTARMLVVGGLSDTVEAARSLVRACLQSGAGVEKFRQSIEAQGGDPAIVDDYDRLPRAARIEELLSEEGGYVTKLDAERVGVASMMLGAGRVRVEDQIDPAVGIVLNKKIGDRVDRGEVLARIYYNDPARLEEARATLREAFRLASERPRRAPLIKEAFE